MAAKAILVSGETSNRLLFHEKHAVEIIDSNES